MSGTGIEITPEADFEPIQAKFSASLLWLVLRATENDDLDYETIPPEVTSPFDSVTPNKIRQPVIDFLCDGVVYAVVFSTIFKADAIITTFDELTDCLLKNANQSCLIDTHLLKPTALKERSAFRLDCHLALIDTLLLCYSHQTVSIKDIKSALRNLCPSEDPVPISSLENGISLWLSTLCDFQNHLFGLLQANGQPKDDQYFPSVDSLVDDVKDGKSLLAMLLFYCNESITIDCVKLSTPLRFTECIHNIQLFRELCAEHICTSIFAVKAEDIAYGPSCLKPIMMALLCEIFLNVEMMRKIETIPVYESLMEPKKDVTSLKSFQLDVEHSNDTIMQRERLIKDMDPNSIVLEDFDHQRTHAMATSVENLAQDRPVSTQAWPNHKSTTKPNRISLDYHPPSALPVIGNIPNRQPNHHLNALHTLTQSINPMNDQPQKLKSNTSSSSSVTITEHGSDTSIKERSKWDDPDDVPSPQFEEDVYGLSSTIPTANKQFDASSVKVPLEKQHIMQLTQNQDDATDDDALSTITEKSEPSSPSVNSYETTQTTSDISNLPHLQMTMSNEFGYPQSSIYNEPPDDDLSVRGSFVTPNRHTVASAKAAGLPIIPQRKDMRLRENQIPMMTNITDTLSSQDMCSEDDVSLSADLIFPAAKSTDSTRQKQERDIFTDIKDDRKNSTPIQMDHLQYSVDASVPAKRHDQLLSTVKPSNDTPVSPRLKWTYLEVDLRNEKHRPSSKKSGSASPSSPSQEDDDIDLNQSANLTTWFELSLRNNDCPDTGDYKPSTDVHVLSPTGDSPTTWAEIMEKASAIDKNVSPEGLSQDIFI